MKRIGIITPGGPAPGLNAAIFGAAQACHTLGFQLFGVRKAFENLMRGDESAIVPIDYEWARSQEPRGGTFLQTSKAYPPAICPGREQYLENCARILSARLDGLVLTGGDGTVTIAYALTDTLRRHGLSLPMVLLPKSVDDDGDFLEGVRMIGASTMAEETGRRIKQLSVDSYSSNDRWQFAVTMGRSSGRLALASTIHGHPQVFVIPEQFSGAIPVSFLSDIIGAAMLKRSAHGTRHGVAVLSEGIIERLDPNSHPRLRELPKDVNGALNPSKFPFQEMLQDLFRRWTEEVGFKLSFQVASHNYDLRGADPNGFDLRMAYELGLQGVLDVAEGKGGHALYKLGSELHRLPFAELVPLEGNGTRTRTVDLESDEYRLARLSGQHLRMRDLRNEELSSAMRSLTTLSEAAFLERFTPVAEWGES